MNFTDEEFEEACRELENPAISEYEFFVESAGVQIYRKYRENSGLYEYKTFGTLDGVGPAVCSQVYCDLEYRKKWDGYVNKLEQFTEGGRQGIYWRVNFPFPMSSRDYVYIRETREFDIGGQHIWVILGRSAPFDSRPPKSGVIRVDDFEQSMVITANGESGSKDGSSWFHQDYESCMQWLPSLPGEED
ncbi:phosphatidylcholine transfer protein-like isoform X2 [Patiria miniata]|uniref:Phosphatidylcholine transfer protein n=1 Tax=Patiria miniata TaxID=46514 RepID=A0A914A2U3_PATMI|nr:phosphatidylcholine transfer protein-like isoform X2 [Patiria miniata]